MEGQPHCEAALRIYPNALKTGLFHQYSVLLKLIQLERNLSARSPRLTRTTRRLPDLVGTARHWLNVLAIAKLSLDGASSSSLS